ASSAASSRRTTTTARCRSTRRAAPAWRAAAATFPFRRRSPLWARRWAPAAAWTGPSSTATSSAERSSRARWREPAGPPEVWRRLRRVLRTARGRAHRHRGRRAGGRRGLGALHARAGAVPARRKRPAPSRRGGLRGTAALHPGGEHFLAGAARLGRLLPARGLRGRLGRRRRLRHLPLPSLALLRRRDGDASAGAGRSRCLLREAEPRPAD